MEVQDYAIENNILYQDNKSTIRNGRMSADKNSKHIKKRSVLVTDKVAIGDLGIQHKGTDEMWADMNTNPTQGKRFRVMCGHVMGIPEDYDDNVERRHMYPLLLPKIKSEQLLTMDGKVLEKASIVVPVKRPTNKSKKRTNVLFPP